MTCPAPIGKLLLIELDKQRLFLLPEDAWFPSKVEVKSPEGHVYNFPIYRWVTDSKVQVFREGAGLCSEAGLLRGSAVAAGQAGCALIR